LKQVNEILCELATKSKKYVPKSPGPRTFPVYVSKKANVSLKKKSQKSWSVERDFKLLVKTGSHASLAEIVFCAFLINYWGHRKDACL